MLVITKTTLFIYAVERLITPPLIILSSPYFHVPVFPDKLLAYTTFSFVSWANCLPYPDAYRIELSPGGPPVPVSVIKGGICKDKGVFVKRYHVEGYKGVFIKIRGYL